MAMTQSSFSCASFPRLLPSTFSPRNPTQTSWSPPKNPPRCRTITSSLKLGVEELAELAHNKVLIAAAVASAIGQLSKPFTSVRNGEGVDFKAAVRSGGMPSTHSAGVVAVATSLGLERGFADSMFGMSVVFAAIVMYDAQGVRREVGNHAKILNKMLTLRESTAQCMDEDDFVNSASEFHSTKSERTAQLLSVPEKVISYGSNANSYSNHSSGTRSSTLNALESTDAEVAAVSELMKAYTEDYNRLSESVGHTELQVLVGALLGFVASIVICATL